MEGEAPPAAKLPGGMRGREEGSGKAASPNIHHPGVASSPLLTLDLFPHEARLSTPPARSFSPTPPPSAGPVGCDGPACWQRTFRGPHPRARRAAAPTASGAQPAASRSLAGGFALHRPWSRAVLERPSLGRLRHGVGAAPGPLERPEKNSGTVISKTIPEFETAQWMRAGIGLSRSGVVVHHKLVRMGPLAELLDFLIFEGDPVVDEIFAEHATGQQIILVAIQGFEGAIEGGWHG